jgi:hypothetical protein
MGNPATTPILGGNSSPRDQGHNLGVLELTEPSIGGKGTGGDISGSQGAGKVNNPSLSSAPASSLPSNATMLAMAEGEAMRHENQVHTAHQARVQAETDKITGSHTAAAHGLSQK